MLALCGSVWKKLHTHTLGNRVKQSKYSAVHDIPHCTIDAMGKTAGRQPLPKAERRSERIFVYVTPAEYRAVKTHRKRGQTISDFVRDAIVAACRPVPNPSPAPPEVAATTPVTAAESVASEPQASPPVPPAPSPEEPAPVPPENHQQPALISEAKAALRHYRGTPIIAPLAYQIAERNPQLVLDVVREAKVAWLSHRELWFLLKERAGE